MERKWVSGLVEGLDVAGPFQVRSRQLRVHRSRSGNYLTLVLADRTGEIGAIAWDDADRFYQSSRDGAIVFVRGRCQVHNGDVQILIDHLSEIDPGEYDPADFLPSSPRDREHLLRKLREHIDGVRHPGLRALLAAVFDGRHLAEFALAPAAKDVHHAYVGGLLEHTLEVVYLCRAHARLYPQEIDLDLLVTAALLHDVGKVREYDLRGGFATTDEGGLLGHIAIADALIVREADGLPELPAELLLRLRHMLLSHHGRHEWQSPQEPKTLEAAALHLADFTSAHLAIFATALRQVERPSNWTARQRVLERRLYAPPRGTFPVRTIRESALWDAADDADGPALELPTQQP